MDQSIDRIQDAELEVLQVLWKAGKPLPLSEIRQSLAEEKRWEASTVKTLLRRLCDKGAVQLVRRGVYEPLVTEDAYQRRTNQKYLSRLFDGSAKKLVASLVSDGALSQEDLMELYEMFNREV